VDERIGLKCIGLKSTAEPAKPTCQIRRGKSGNLVGCETEGLVLFTEKIAQSHDRINLLLGESRQQIPPN
jgi:hypothetical protein